MFSSKKFCLAGIEFQSSWHRTISRFLEGQQMVLHTSNGSRIAIVRYAVPNDRIVPVNNKSHKCEKLSSCSLVFSIVFAS